MWYHGVFAPDARIRNLIVPGKGNTTGTKIDRSEHKPTAEGELGGELTAPLTWAQRLKRVFDIDITACPLCGGTMRVIADITDPDVIQSILDHIEAQPPPLKSADTAT